MVRRYLRRSRMGAALRDSLGTPPAVDAPAAGLPWNEGGSTRPFVTLAKRPVYPRKMAIPSTCYTGHGSSIGLEFLYALHRGRGAVRCHLGVVRTGRGGVAIAAGTGARCA